MIDAVKRKFPLSLNLQLFAADNDDGDDDKKVDDDGDQPGVKKVEMTQAELDALIAKRISRVEKKYAGVDEKLSRLDALEKAEEERKKADMTEKERLEAEKAEAAKKAQEAEESARKAQEAANRRIIDTEIRSIARAMNANDANDVLSFVDKSAVSIDEDGNVVGAEEAVKAVKDAKPYLFKAPIGADAGGGSNPNKNPDKSVLAAKEKEYEELRVKALGDRKYLRQLNALYHEIQSLKSKSDR